MTTRTSSSGRERTTNEWFTPMKATAMLLSHLDIDYTKPLKVFEPSAGEGDMIAAFVEKMQTHGYTFDAACAMVTCVEYFEDNAKVIKSRFPAATVYCGDALNQSTWKLI